jgi:transaldolase
MSSATPMSHPIHSLIASGTKVWLDSIDPDEVARNRAWGVTGATSNPIIIADLIKSGRLDDPISRMIRQGLDDPEIAWRMTDTMVSHAQEVFLPVWEQTRGDDGYVSFELDPLLEDPDHGLSDPERAAEYVRLGKQWGLGRKNRLIKVPATPGGIAALEELAAAGVALNVTLIFTMNQYQAARDAIWRGAQKRGALSGFKSVYSIFISRIDVYTAKHLPELSEKAQGLVGIVNAKRVWRANTEFWAANPTPLKQDIVFASTGAKLPGDPPWKYVEALAGSDVMTNPPATNAAVQSSGRTFTRQVDHMPPDDVLAEIDAKVDIPKLEAALVTEGVKKFAEPQKVLLTRLADQRRSLEAVAAR